MTGTTLGASLHLDYGTLVTEEKNPVRHENNERKKKKERKNKNPKHDVFRRLNSQASHFQKIPQFNLTDHSNPHPENRPLNINYYNQVRTDFKADA